MTKAKEHDNHHVRDLGIHSSSNEDRLNDLQVNHELLAKQVLHLDTDKFHQAVPVSSKLHCGHAKFREQC